MSEEAFRWVVTAAMALACVSFLTQAIMALALYRLSRKFQEKATPVVDKAGLVVDKAGPLMEQARPILENARQILEQARPRIAEISAEAAEMARTASGQVRRLGEFLDDTTGRARTRIARIDAGVDHTVAKVEQLGESLKGAALRPVREASGVWAGVRAAVSTLAHNARRPPSVASATQDEEMFI